MEYGDVSRCNRVAGGAALLLAGMFLLAGPHLSLAASPAPLPRTGQTDCFDVSGNQLQSCAGTGQDGEAQAGVAWPASRFNINSDSTVTDALTGLAWSLDANAPGPAACDPGMTKTWPEALGYVACLNTAQYLGNSDWRLPNIKDLWSLFNAVWTPDVKACRSAEGLGAGTANLDPPTSHRTQSRPACPLWAETG